jgi:hypothetical protein
LNNQDYIIQLTSQLLEKVYDKNVLLSSLINGSKRIAKLRGDFKNLWWLEWESCNINEKSKLQEFPKSAESKFDQTEFTKLSVEFWEKWVSERQFPTYDKNQNSKKNDNILASSVEEIESRLLTTISKRNSLSVTSGMHPLDKYFVEKENTQFRMLFLNEEESCLNILSRIKTRVHNFLSETEFEIISGKVLSSFFDKNKTYVETELCCLYEKFELHFIELNKRLQDDNSDSLSQALLLVRIILKDFADCIYPSTAEKVVCNDGKERTLSEDKYISRIWQFVYENLKDKSSSVDLLKTQLNDLGNRIDEVYEKSCKGVHSVVNSFETYQCIIQLYVSLGDILRLTKK